MKAADHDWNRESHAPYKFTEVVRMKYLALLAQGYGRTAAADTVGVSPKTVRRYAKGNPGFDEDIMLAERRVVDAAEKALIEVALVEKDLQALKFLLERLDRQKWGDSRTVKHEVEGQVKHLLKLPTDEAIAQLDADLAERRRALTEGGEMFDEDDIIDAEIVETDEADDPADVAAEPPTEAGSVPEPAGLPAPWDGS